MRVVGGKYRSRQLVSPDGDCVRPTSDKVKESIFGSIQFDIGGAVFVDLFSGSGSMGIEALSRGADKVYFVDNSKVSIDFIKKNISKIKLDADDNYEIINDDYKSALRRITHKVDIIFVDAPYKDKPLENILKIVRENDMLIESGKIIYEHLFEDGESDVGDDFEVTKRKKYGTIQVEVIRRI